MPGDQHNPQTLYLHDNHKVHHAMYSGKREFNFLVFNPDEGLRQQKISQYERIWLAAYWRFRTCSSMLGHIGWGRNFRPLIECILRRIPSVIKADRPWAYGMSIRDLFHCTSTLITFWYPVQFSLRIAIKTILSVPPCIKTEKVYIQATIYHHGLAANHQKNQSKIRFYFSASNQ